MPELQKCIDFLQAKEERSRKIKKTRNERSVDDTFKSTASSHRQGPPDALVSKIAAQVISRRRGMALSRRVARRRAV